MSENTTKAEHRLIDAIICEVLAVMNKSLEDSGVEFDRNGRTMDKISDMLNDAITVKVILL